MAGVIQKSSNIGTAKVAMKLGEERVYQALRMFGFGEKTNLPFRTETSGYLPRVSKWDGLSITRFPIGYGIRVTPLQMLRAYCALANGGRMPQLRSSTASKTPRPVKSSTFRRASPSSFSTTPRSIAS